MRPAYRLVIRLDEESGLKKNKRLFRMKTVELRSESTEVEKNGWELKSMMKKPVLAKHKMQIISVYDVIC